MGHWTPSIKLHHITEILASLQGPGARALCGCAEAAPLGVFVCNSVGLHGAVNRSTCDSDISLLSEHRQVVSASFRGAANKFWWLVVKCQIHLQ